MLVDDQVGGQGLTLEQDIECDDRARVLSERDPVVAQTGDERLDLDLMVTLSL